MKGIFTSLMMSMLGREESAASPAPSSSAKSDKEYNPRKGFVDYSLVSGSYQALCIATVYRCLTVLGGAVASLPLRYMRKGSNGVFTDQVGSRIAYLLNVRPCPQYNAPDFWNRAIHMVHLNGNAYIVPIWSVVNLGEPEMLILCNRGTVNHDTLNGIYHISDPEQGLVGDFEENEVIHLMNLTLDGKTGISTLSFAAQAMSIAATGDKETLNRFANGGNVRGIVSNDTSVRGFGEYQDTELQKTAKDLDSRFQSGERIVSLPGQAQFSPLSLSSVDMEFLNSRKFSVREICRFFGVPPTFVFDDTSNNYKSAEMANVSFLSQTLNPLLTKIESELLGKLISPAIAHKYKFQFDRRELYASDLGSKADYQTKTIAAGVYTINDWRRYENMPTVPGGDEVLVTANVKSLRELLNPQAPASSTPVQEPAPANKDKTDTDEED